MGKKHGFKGTPVRPPQPSGMGRVFASRGDPLMTEREGIKDFQRKPETEDPDFDRMFAPLARDLLKPSQVDKTNQIKKVQQAQKPEDIQRKVTAMILAGNAKFKKALKAEEGRVVQKGRVAASKDTGIVPDPSAMREKRDAQTPDHLKNKPSSYDFSGKTMPKEIKKHGKIYRIK